ncbi:MAG: nucleoside-diphosphate sugar epimerase/dehydratase, partial [Petrimonas sp.]|nr:nucleoside-diphosphate sugar epimerase/dehydratase [Petrimonas sp.]
MSRFFENYISNRILSRFSILVIDIFMIVFSCMLTYFLRYSFDGLGVDVRAEGLNLMLILILFNLVFFFIFKTFSGILRFSSFADLLSIVYSLTLGYLTSFIALKIYSRYDTAFHVSNVIFFSTYVLNVMIMVFSRIFVKEVYETLTKQNTSPMNVFVYGTKEAGISVAKALKGNSDFNYRVRGFISDDRQMIGKTLLGTRVFENNDNLYRFLEKRNIKKIIVSPQKMKEIQNTPVLDRFLDSNISLMTTLPVSDWKANGLLRKPQIKEIQIEDLLPREPIAISMRNIASNIEGKRVMITGAAGSIGSEIVRQVAAFNPFSITLVDQAETPLHDMRLEMKDKWRELKTSTIVADISNASRMDHIFARTRPQYIFHAAAYKHVPMMEDDVSESIQTNVLGTKTLADLAVKYKAERFVMVSTDKAVNPSNIMGCSKRICEIYIQSLDKHLQKKGGDRTQFITTRFGNVLGSNGSVIPLFKEQIKNGGPVTVTHPEIIRYFMTISEACQLVLEAGSMGNGGEIYIFDMGEPVKIVDLAKKMIRLSGSQNIKIEFTGLRHGEKLYEELLNIAEYTKPTHHEKIMVADVREYEYDVVKKKIEDLIQES